MELAEINLEDLLGDNVLPDPVMYQYYRGLSENTIVINDEICDNIVEWAILPLERMDRDKNIDHIDIVLNSCGGNVYLGFALIAAIEKCTTPITIRVVGVAASMAGMIAMAKGDHIETVCDKYSVFLIHDGSSYFTGTSSKVKDVFKFNESYEKKIKEFILTHTKIDEEMYQEIERQEFWFDADRAVELGVVDRIL